MTVAPGPRIDRYPFDGEVPRGTPIRGFCRVAPYQYLGTELNLAARQMGMEAGRPLQAASGWVVVFLRNRMAVGHSVQTGEAEARRQAEGWVRGGTSREAFLGRARASLAGKVLYWLTERVESVPLIKFWEEGLEAIEIWKAGPANPLEPEGFDSMVDRMAHAFEGIADPADKNAMKRVLARFARETTPEGLASAANGALAQIRTVPPIVEKPQSALLKKEGGNIALKVKQGLVDKYEFGLKATLSAYDDRVTDFLSKSNGNFVRDEYGNRSNSLSKQAKAIISQMEAEGRSVKDMQEALAEKLGTSNVLRSRAYWRGVSNVFVNRSRTYTAFGTYQEASITLFEVSAVMDEATTDVCRFMDGKILDLNSAMANFSAIEKSGEEPINIKTINPFIRQVKAGPSTFLALKIPNVETGKPPHVIPVAQVMQSGFGTQGKGKYAARHEDDALQGTYGVNGPPYHVNCRTTTIPVIKTHRSPVAVPRVAETPSTPSLAEGESLDEAVTRREKEIDGLSGAAFSADETDIEGQEIQMRREVIDDEAFYVTRFKLTEHAGARLAPLGEKYKAGPQVYELKRSALDGIKNGKIQKKARVKTFDSVHFKLDGVRVNMVTQEGSLKNFVEVRVQAANPRAAFQTYKRAMGSWGVKSSGSLPTATATEVAKKSAIIGRWKPARIANLTDGLAKAKPGEEVTVIRKFWDEVKTPEMEATFKDTEAREVFPGHLSYYSKTQAAQMKNVPYLAHSVSSSESLGFITDPRPGFGGLKSSNYRYQQGLTFNGMSTDSDFQTGGADGAFLRIANTKKGADVYSKRMVIVNSRVLGRMDWWAYNGDNYGKTEKRLLGSRLSVMDVKQRAGTDTLSSSNEIMFRAGVPLEDIHGVVVREKGERDKLKADLLEKGVKEINGKPLDKFFVENLSQLDMKGTRRAATPAEEGEE